MDAGDGIGDQLGEVDVGNEIFLHNWILQIRGVILLTIPDGELLKVYFNRGINEGSSPPLSTPRELNEL